MEQSEMKKYKISVVIPVYNGEKYLKECIDSIFAQSFKEYELVLVDDGSKDSSGVICDNYAAKYDFIHVYHKTNEGINQTRRYGVKVAQGEWIAFCDQDDSMPDYALQILWDKHQNTDIVIGFLDTPVHRRALTLEECQENAITAKLFPPTPWAKLYRKAILTDNIFDFPKHTDGAEDMIMNIRLMFKIRRAPHFVFRKVYNFRRNTSSVSHRLRPTLRGAELYHEVRLSSMPKWAQEKFLKATIFIRLNGLTGIAYSYPETLCNKNHPFLLQLREDINRSNYIMNLQERLLINLKFKWMYRCVSFLIIVKNFVRYRLGLNN